MFHTHAASYYCYRTQVHGGVPWVPLDWMIECLEHPSERAAPGGLTNLSPSANASVNARSSFLACKTRLDLRRLLDAVRQLLDMIQSSGTRQIIYHVAHQIARPGVTLTHAPSKFHLTFNTL